MRRAIKNPNSEILEENLEYIPHNSHNNKKIADILYLEQKNFCAYTDEYISVTDAGDIDHFNPTVKGSDTDNYYNWFLVKHKWNSLKSTKWKNYQPILHPTADDFEERIIYVGGDYMAKHVTDIEAQNLIYLLKLDHPVLAEKRKKYIARKREEINDTSKDAITFFSYLINADPCHISYLRAIREEFGIDLWQMLN